MGTTNQHNLQGLHATLELGKNGQKIVSGSGKVSVTQADGATLIPMEVGAATASTHAVTQAQLDVVAGKSGGYLSYSYDASGNISQLSGQGSGDSGAIRHGDTYKIGTAGTFLGEAAEVGDFIVALVANPDISDNTSSNTDWLHDERRTASDLADGTTLDAANGKLLIKDAGVGTDKIAAAAVTTAKINASAVTEAKINNLAVTDAKLAAAAVTTDKIAATAVTEAKMSAGVTAKLANSEALHDTNVPNIETAIGGSFDSDNEGSIAAQTNYLTTTTIVGQLSQADSTLKLHHTDNAVRKLTAAHDAGTQNVGDAIKSGRVITAVMIRPTTIANGSGCTMTIGIAGDTDKYATASAIDLYDAGVSVINVNLPLSSDEQIIATVTQGTATQGTFQVTVLHG